MPHSHISIMFNFTLHVSKTFHMVNIDVPAGAGAPPLDTSPWREFLTDSAARPQDSVHRHYCSQNVKTVSHLKNFHFFVNGQKFVKLQTRENLAQYLITGCGNTRKSPPYTLANSKAHYHQLASFPGLLRFFLFFGLRSV